MNKMVKCPLCNEEIDCLNAYCQIVQTLEINEKGDAEVTGLDYCDDNNSFECPECHEVITKDEKEAIKFLKGEK